MRNPIRNHLANHIRSILSLPAGLDVLQAIRSYGAAGNLWLPGIGTVNGLDTKNFDNDAFLACVVDGPVGFVGSTLATDNGNFYRQTTTEQKPLLRRGSFNFISRSTPTGAAPGNPGTGPTGWSVQLGTVNGVTRTIVSAGSIGGVPSFVLRLQGTFAAQENVSVVPPPGVTGVSTVPNSPFTASMWWGVQAGTLPNPSTAGLGGVRLRFGAGGLLAQLSSGVVQTGFQRHSVSGTAPASTTNTGMDWLWPFAAGATVDVSIAFGGAQFERGLVMGPFTETVGTPRSNQSVGNYAWAFDGSNDFLSLNTPLAATPEFYTAAGYYHDVLSPGNKAVFSVHNTNSPPVFWPWLGHNGATGNVVYPRMSLRNDTTNITLQSPQAVDGGTFIIIEGFVRGGRAILAVNGVEVLNQAQTIAPATGITEAFIGATRWNGSLADQWGGRVAGVVDIRGAVRESDRALFRRLLTERGQLV